MGRRTVRQRSAKAAMASIGSSFEVIMTSSPRFSCSGSGWTSDASEPLQGAYAGCHLSKTSVPRERSGSPAVKPSRCARLFSVNCIEIGIGSWIPAVHALSTLRQIFEKSNQNTKR
jgi:hypothetical protein